MHFTCWNSLILEFWLIYNYALHTLLRITYYIYIFNKFIKIRLDYMHTVKSLIINNRLDPKHANTDLTGHISISSNSPACSPRILYLIYILMVISNYCHLMIQLFVCHSFWFLRGVCSVWVQLQPLGADCCRHHLLGWQNVYQLVAIVILNSPVWS